MSRVRVYGRLTGDRRDVSVGGRGRNDSIESWINFDAGKEKEYTEAVTTDVCFNKDNGKIIISFDCENALEIPEDYVEIYINGKHIKNKRDIMREDMKRRI